MKGWSPLRRWLRQERARDNGLWLSREMAPSIYGAAAVFYMGIDMAVPRHDPRCTPEMAFEELAPWQDITEGDETVFATPGKIGPFTIENPNAVVYPERIAEAQFRAPDYVPPPPPADWISLHNLPPAGGVGGRGFKGPYR